ncbi:hypothetical protein JFL43_19305 [Viridibacillus sp. YIM B01967]|jgi:hypothetical protein|uniref:Multidrug ABC transporter ATPase n=1 Tax=Viridibacillus soli TaxID=2798301 RepID=A0ABS1HBX9_9BACL|nr:hypothetical protein [Viridibacillus soli]MBK3496966.1 hypothetical protein [Viridibacillus soli]
MKRITKECIFVKGADKVDKYDQEPVNGSMATSMEELKQLGKQMDRMRDGEELKRDGRVPDPVQSDKAPPIEIRKD